MCSAKKGASPIFLLSSSPHLIDDDASFLISRGVPALAAVELSEGPAARSLQGAPRRPRAPSVVAMLQGEAREITKERENG